MKRNPQLNPRPPTGRRKRVRFTFWTFIGAALTLCLSCHAQLSGLAESHIVANVPGTNDFRPFLIRDLAAYLKPKHGDKLAVDYELLRDGPTQSGVAYPKFYLWLRATNAENAVVRGPCELQPLKRSGSMLLTSFPAPT